MSACDVVAVRLLPLSIFNHRNKPAAMSTELGALGAPKQPGRQASAQELCYIEVVRFS